MKAKLRYESMEEVPAGMRECYREENGNFVLDVDGPIEQGKSEEFNREKISLLKQLDEMKQRFDGIDPEAVRELEAQNRKLEEEQALKAGEVERVVESRLKVHKKHMTDLTSERDALVARLSEIQIDQGVVAVATKHGLRPGAIPDITARAHRVFKLVKGVPTAFEADGQSVRMGQDGPLTLEEWVATQRKDAPFLFTGSDGAGVGGTGGGAASAAVDFNAPERNPFAKETWNLTEQARLKKTQPKVAERLRKEAARR